MTGSNKNVALPEYAYVPGRTPRHDEGFLDHVISAAPAQTLDRSARDNPAWSYSLRLMQNAYYWEAHEVLEELWRRAAPNSRERYLVRGLIHIANAALKMGMQRCDAATRLSRLAQECIRDAFSSSHSPTLMLLHRDQLLQHAKTCDTTEFAFTAPEEM